jgi:GxxExxY protein
VLQKLRQCDVAASIFGRNPVGAIPAPYGVMEGLHDDIDSLTDRVIACAIEVHKQMGPGLNEGIYAECMVLELAARGIPFECDVPVLVSYKGRRLRKRFEIDLLVDKRLIVELKAVDALHPVHQAQVITYLRLTGHPAGLLLNFNDTTLLAGLKRLDHPERYAAKRDRIGTRHPRRQ